MTTTEPTTPLQADVDALTGLLDLMANFSSNEQRARYLLSSDWLRNRGAAAAAHAGGPVPSPHTFTCWMCGEVRDERDRLLDITDAQVCSLCAESG